MAMKQRFMLDTNAVCLLLERRSPVLDQWSAEERCSLSAIVAAEIRDGLERRQLTQARADLVEALLVVLPIDPIESQVAVVYGRLRAALQRAGRSLSAMDLLIASHALALDRMLISADQAFHAVPGLQICSPAG